MTLPNLPGHLQKRDRTIVGEGGGVLPAFAIILISASLKRSGKYPAESAALKVSLSRFNASGMWDGNALLILLQPGDGDLLHLMALVMSSVVIIVKLCCTSQSVGVDIAKDFVLCKLSPIYCSTLSLSLPSPSS